jgi:hypothetical protein
VKKLFLLLLLLSSSPAWATDYCADANAVACWRFREGSGTTVDDSTANSNVGNFASSGHPAWTNTGLPKAYLAYGASFVPNDYIDAGASVPTSSNFSIISWIKSSAVDSFALATRTSSSAQGFDFLTGVGSTAGSWQFRVFGATSSRTSAAKTGLNDGNYHLVTGVIEGGGATRIQFYVDAVSIENNPNTLGTITNSQNFYFARRGTTYTTCSISETAVFSRGISSAEVSDIMDNGLSPTPVVVSNESLFRNFTGGNWVWKRN